MDHRAIVQKSLDYIEDNLQTDLTAEELADMAGFSLYHYYRIFQAATGLPVKQYILRRRLLHAVYAIGQGSRGIDGALAYGFDTYAGFYRAVQREFGCTPSEFLSFSRAKKPYRLNLYQEAQKMVTHKQIRKVLGNWGLEESTISDVYSEETGNKKETACYVGEDYVLKFTANLGKLQTHAALAKALAARGLGASVPVPAADGREWVQAGELYFCLTRRLPGRQLTGAELFGPEGQKTAYALGRSLGRLHLALGTVEACVEEADLLGTVQSWALPKTAEILGWSSHWCRSWLEGFAARYDLLPRQIIHRDPNPGNLFRQGETWHFLDFELSERNVRLYDPCYAASAILSENFGDASRREQWLGVYRGVLQGYDSEVHLTEVERKAAPDILLANQMVCTAWFAEQNKYAELLEINRKMTLWLQAHWTELQL